MIDRYDVLDKVKSTEEHYVIRKGVNQIFGGFDGSTMTSIEISESVTLIRSGAFYGCSNLTRIIISESVTEIETDAFFKCQSLNSIDVSPDNKNYCSIDGVLYSKDAKTLIAYPMGKDDDFAIPDSVTRIGVHAFFFRKSLKSVEIPESVTTIECSAFHGCCNLTSIVIPNSVIQIEDNAFNGCLSLNSIYVCPDNPSYCSIDGVLYSKDAKTLIAYPNSKGPKFAIPDSVTEIGNCAFNWCCDLRSIVIPNSVTKIEDKAFERCSGLSSIVIPESVKQIGTNAFNECFSLNSIYVCPDNPNYCSIDGVLYSKDAKTLIAYPIGQAGELFAIPDSVTKIGDNAFEGGRQLTSIVIPMTVKQIGNNAFLHCASLTNIVIPESVKQIGNNAFDCCTSLTSIEIPSSATKILREAFSFCRSLTSIVIPDSVKRIESRAFLHCTSLKEVHCRIEHIEKLKISANAFDYCNLSECTLYVPVGTEYAYRHHPIFSQFKEIIIEK